MFPVCTIHPIESIDPIDSIDPISSKTETWPIRCAEQFGVRLRLDIAIYTFNKKYQQTPH